MTAYVVCFCPSRRIFDEQVYHESDKFLGRLKRNEDSPFGQAVLREDAIVVHAEPLDRIAEDHLGGVGVPHAIQQNAVPFRRRLWQPYEIPRQQQKIIMTTKLYLSKIKIRRFISKRSSSYYVFKILV
jgi:hypothetical protein